MVRITLTFESSEDDMWGFDQTNLDSSSVRDLIMEDPAQFVADCHLKAENISDEG